MNRAPLACLVALACAPLCLAGAGGCARVFRDAPSLDRFPRGEREDRVPSNGRVVIFLDGASADEADDVTFEQFRPGVDDPSPLAPARIFGKRGDFLAPIAFVLEPNIDGLDPASHTVAVVVHCGFCENGETIFGFDVADDTLDAAFDLAPNTLGAVTWQRFPRPSEDGATAQAIVRVPVPELLRPVLIHATSGDDVDMLLRVSDFGDGLGEGEGESDDPTAFPPTHDPFAQVEAAPDPGSRTCMTLSLVDAAGHETRQLPPACARAPE